MKELNATAHKLLDAAEHYTQTQGFNAFSYKDLQNDVGVKTATIHYYFPTKQDLAVRMTERYLQRYREFLLETAQHSDSGRERLEKLSKVFIDVQRKGKFCMCGMLASDIVALPKHVTDQLAEFFDINERWIREAIELGIKNKEFKKSTDPQTAATQFFALLEGSMLIARTRKNSRYMKTVIEQALAHL